MKRVYLEGGHEKVLNRIRKDDDITESELSFFKFPKDDEISENGLCFTHMSYFEPWDSYRNYVVAKEECGLIEKDDGNMDTFTNFAQNELAILLAGDDKNITVVADDDQSIYRFRGAAVSNILEFMC